MRIAELAVVSQSDAVITYSSAEAALLRTEMAPTKVHVMPWSIVLQPTLAPFGEASPSPAAIGIFPTSTSPYGW